MGSMSLHSSSQQLSIPVSLKELLFYSACLSVCLSCAGIRTVTTEENTNT